MKTFKTFNESKEDLSKIKKEYLRFINDIIFKPNIEEYKRVKEFDEEADIITLLLKLEDGDYIVKAVFALDELEKDHYGYNEEEGKFSPNEITIEAPEEDFYEYEEFIEDYSEIIMKVTIEDYIKNVVKTKDAIISLNESKDDMIKKYLKLKEEEYEEDYQDEESYYSDQTSVLFSVNHNGKEFYIDKRAYLRDNLVDKVDGFIYVPEIDQWVNNNMLYMVDLKLSTPDKTTYIAALGARYNKLQIEELYRIDYKSWADVREERNRAFVKLNESKSEIPRNIEKAYLEITEKHFSELKKPFLDNRENDDDDLDRASSSIFRIDLEDGTYYLLLVEDFIGNWGGLEELFSYVYIEEESKFVKYNPATNIIDDENYHKYMEKYSNVIDQLGFDDIYEISTEGLNTYSAKDGELTRIKELGIRKWLRMQKERDKLFITMNESVSEEDIINFFHKEILKSSEYQLKLIDDGEDINENNAYYLYKRDGHYFIVKSIDFGYSMNNDYFIYVEELENGDYVTKNTLVDSGWIENIIIGLEEYDDYVYELRDALAEFKELHHAKKLDDITLIERKGIMEIKDIVDKSRQAFVNLNERIVNFKKFKSKR